MVPSWLQAIILGVVQGVTEFVPVSSSGHLVLVPYLLGWERPGLAFDVALHFGTALAILVYFRTELLGVAAGFLRGGRSPEHRMYRRLGLLLVLASVPVAIAGLVFQDFFERVFETPPVAAGFLFVTAALLVGGERLRARRVAATSASRVLATDAQPPAGAGAAVDEVTGEDPSDPAGRSLAGIGPRAALVVGVAQCAALFPGISRSGTTITAGIAAGLSRPAATRFAFLLALPAMLGAAMLSLPDLAQPGPYSGADIAAGVVASFLAGYLAIAFLIRLVARAGLGVFSKYLLVAGIVGLVASAILGPPA